MGNYQRLQRHAIEDYVLDIISILLLLLLFHVLIFTEAE
jgi:hypothetical protein